MILSTRFICIVEKSLKKHVFSPKNGLPPSINFIDLCVHQNACHGHEYYYFACLGIFMYQECRT